MIRFDTKKDMEHYDNLYHQIYEKDKEIERLKNQLDFIEEQNHIIDKLEKENKIIKSQLNICSQDLYIENLKLKLENERLKELCDKYEEEHKTTFEYWKRLVKEDYKSRNEKAIEYVEHHKFNKFGDIDCGEAEEIINILNGGDDNE